MANHDPDIRNEPHLQPDAATPDATEAKADRTLDGRRMHGAGREHQQALNSVFNEPFSLTTADMSRVIDRDWFCARCGYNMRGHAVTKQCPECGHAGSQTYAAWVADKCRTVKPIKSWLAAALVTLVGGPLAISGALWAGSGFLGPLVWGPVAEEIMKVAAVTFIVETRPYLFQTRVQIHLAALGGALGFAVVENLLYLFVYIKDPTPTLVVWRWSVCVALHVGCTMIAARGIVAVWHDTITTGAQPSIAHATRWLIVAMVVHGAYNGVVIFLKLSEYEF